MMVSNIYVLCSCTDFLVTGNLDTSLIVVTKWLTERKEYEDLIEAVLTKLAPDWPKKQLCILPL